MREQSAERNACDQAPSAPLICGPDSVALEVDRIYCGDARQLMLRIAAESVALSFWSPPYFVGKSYERTWSFEEWSALLSEVISQHFAVLMPGGFLVINIADILAFPDPTMPRIQADNIATKRQGITRQQILEAKAEHPEYNRYQLAALLGCSEQTIQRRTEHNNVRGGKYEIQRKVKLVGGLVQKWAEAAGFYLYDRRVWVKDPCWENSRWHSISYRSVDEFEYIYVFWKPGITTVDRGRLSRQEWADWGSRAVWDIRSVRTNDEHEAQFPLELPRRVIRLFSAPHDLVLDPFIGSGTTAVAALQQRRHYLGFELMPEYAALASENVNRTQTTLWE
jgi:site-specific DNA-methyltransferase (adenine-specific)